MLKIWEYNITQSSKLSLFRSLKSSCMDITSYLYNVTLRKYRSGLAKLRCSSHSLRIEKGRHVNELMAERVCRLCEANGCFVLDDEYHFMMCCPLLADTRNNYLHNLTAGDNSYQQCIVLLSSEDAEMQKCVASFILHANKKRQELMRQ